MKLMITLCLIVAVSAVPPIYQYQPSETSSLLRYENDIVGVGGWKFGFEQTDGQRVDQQGEVVNEGREDEYVAVRGSYSWVSPDGVTYTVNYIADDKGFQPEIQKGNNAPTSIRVPSRIDSTISPVITALLG